MATLFWTGATDNDWNTVTNWSTGSAPTNGDHVYIERSNVSITGDLNQSSVALASLNIAMSFTGTIGGSSADYLQIGTAILNVGYDWETARSTGSGRININLGSATACQVTVHNTGQTPADNGFESLRLLAANAATDLFLYGGRIGIAQLPGETSTIDDYVIGQPGSSRNLNVEFGAGMTMDDGVVHSGRVVFRSALSDLDVNGGEVWTRGSGAVSTMDVNGGVVYPCSSGTITTLAVTGGTVDFRRASVGRTVTNTTVNGSGTVHMIAGVTLTNVPSSSTYLQFSTSRASI